MGRLQNMSNANRIIFNSVVIYFKIFVDVSISLISVPIVMSALGNSDYGLYNLVAGVIGLLAFLKSAMSVSTQRFISVAIGENKLDRINGIFNTSLVLHLIIGVLIVLVFELFALFMFDGFLNIEEGRESAAKIIFQFLVVTTFLGIACVPYEGVMNAKEDMLFFSIIGIVSSILKLLLAFYLRVCPYDRLIVYGAAIAFISLGNITTYIVFTRVKYKEYVVRLREYYDKNIMKEILGFTGWNTFGALALVGRSQGIAIVFNRFFGTVLNASYGIANQINGALSYFSNSFHKAIAPQLMKSHGARDDGRMIKLAYVTSKISFIVMAFVAIPLIIEMPYILNLWLKTPPDYTAELCRCILLLSLVNQYSVGLMNSISASGVIRNYQIMMSVLILSNVPISYVLLEIGLPPYYCTIGFVVIEVISLIVRLIMSKKLVGIQITGFIKQVIQPTVICFTLAIIPGLLFNILLPSSFLRVVIVFLSYMAVFAIAVWHISLVEEEKAVLRGLFNKFKKNN